MPDLTLEAERFRDWAAALSTDDGQWECMYEAWPALHAAVLTWAVGCATTAPPEDEVRQALYAIARDNDTQYLVSEIRKRDPEALHWLTRAALAWGEEDARWQLAVELGRLEPGDETESLLLALATDASEYVRRRSIRALTRIGSRAAEDLAWASWHRVDENQEWARISALGCLRYLKSPHFAALLAEALQDERPYLRECAERMRDEGVVG